MSLQATVTQFSGGVSAYKYPTIQGVADYLYWMCGKYGLEAQNIINSGGGGYVNVVTLPPVFPFAITSADFESDGITYNNPRIVGQRVMIFINQWSQQWFTDQDNAFIYTARGIQIIFPGFDAMTQQYTIIIEKDNS